MENFIKSPYAEWSKLNVSFEILKNNDQKKYFHLVQRIEDRLREKYEENLLRSAEECPEVKRMKSFPIYVTRLGEEKLTVKLKNF